jgi:hypothetical protein
MSIAKSAIGIMKQALRSEGFRRLLDDAGRLLVVREIVEVVSGDDDSGDGNGGKDSSPDLPSDPLPPGARDLPGLDPGKPIA